MIDAWPDEGVEGLGACPVCASPDRTLLFEGLTDDIFRAAPGTWNLHSCAGCGTGYLDPRPTADSIHLAYRGYHTHEEPRQQPASELRGLRLAQRLLANGYKNWRFGTNLEPSSRWGAIIAFLLPVQRAILDRQFRHLPAPVLNGRVLDIGFGDAGFMENARAMGWQVVGTDFDPQVVESARRRGFQVHLGTIDEVDGPFEVITMSHVIEHVHDPVSVLRACHRLLAPGGILWLETPNIKAAGLRRFGRHWRGLEPPRHLVLFNRKSLECALAKTGYVQIRDLPQPSPVHGMYVMSARLRDGGDPYAPGHLPILLRVEMALAKLFEWIWKPRREFLAVAARKAL